MSVMFNFVLSVILSGNLIACRESFKYDKQCSEIKKIIIINKTSNEYISDTSAIIEAGLIGDFCSIMKDKIEITQPNVASNRGYFQIEIVSNTGQVSDVDVMYTVFDGVVIRNGIDHYSKQDKISDFILRNVGNRTPH